MKNAKILKYLEVVAPLIQLPLYWEDVNSVILGGNEAVFQGSGARRANAYIGKTLYELYPKEMADHIKIHNEQVMHTGLALSQEEVIEDITTGKLKYFMASKSPIHDDDGNVIGIVGTSFEITEKKEAEQREKQALEGERKAVAEKIEAEMQRANTEKDLRQAVMILSGSIAHDLRTPLASMDALGGSIDKYLDQLIDGYEKAKEAGLVDNPLRKRTIDSLKRATSSIHHSCEFMNNSIDETLKTLSQALPDASNESKLLECSILSCVQETIEGYPLEENQLNLIHNQIKHDFKFSGNKVLMIRILMNLFKNALYQIKKSNQGEIYITSEIGEEFNYLNIKDTAGGAPDSVVKTLFDGYKSTKSEGTGIGLAYCKNTMRDFGGDIACKSDFGDYIEFTLSFPKPE